MPDDVRILSLQEAAESIASEFEAFMLDKGFELSGMDFEKLFELVGKENNNRLSLFVIRLLLKGILKELRGIRAEGRFGDAESFRQAKYEDDSGDTELLDEIEASEPDLIEVINDVRADIMELSKPIVLN